MREVPIHQPCFGRAADLEKLQERVRQRGVTFVMAPPRMGKTWLVRNLAFGWARHQGWNIGYAESSGGKNDLLREVVSDLYKRWLDGAGLIAQAKSLWDRHKGQLVGKVGGEVGKLLGKIAVLADGDLVGAEKLIDETFDILTRAEQDLRSGGQTLKPITYKDARDLVGTVATVTGKPILLVMDAWERGLDLTTDRGSIQKLLDNQQEWPVEFHLVIVIRDRPKHQKEVVFANECCETYPSAARTVVDLLDLSNLDEQERLLLYLRDKIPAVAEADRQWVVEQCRSPAVIEWWIRRQPADRESLTAEGANARKSQYMGLFDLIEQAREQTPLFDTTVRLALLPEITSAAMWQPYRLLMDAVNSDAVIADLQGRRILDPNQPAYPSFGHTTAYDAVNEFMLRVPTNQSQPDLRPRVRNVLKALIRDLAERIHRVTPETRPFGAALAGTGAAVMDAELDVVWVWPARLALLLFGRRLDAAERKALLAVMPTLDAELPGLRVLLAQVLFNMVADAKDEQDLPRRDAMVQELRKLSQAHPRDAGVRETLAKVLFNTIQDAKDEQNLARRNALLTELRELSKAHPEDAAVREQLAMGLVYSLHYAKDEQDLPRRDTLLTELRELRQPHPEDAAVRERLAMGLFTTLEDAKTEQDLPRRDALLTELRGLSEAHPDDATVREPLAMGLLNTLIDAKGEQDLERRDALLTELRELRQAHPEDAAVRERLAKGLFNTLVDAKDEQDLPRCDALLTELRELLDRYADDERHATVRAGLDALLRLG